MASDIATATTSAAAPARPASQSEAPAKRRRLRRSRFSLLTWRILAINVLALALLGGGLLLLGEYRQSLISAELQSLQTQAQVFAGAVGEGATTDALGNGIQLVTPLARDMMRRLVEPTKTRAQLLDAKGTVIADTAVLGTAGAAVEIDKLAPPESGGAVHQAVTEIYDWLVAHSPWSTTPRLVVAPHNVADDPLVIHAFLGEVSGAARGAGAKLVLTAAAPVQYYKQILGVIVLSNNDPGIEQTVRNVRFAIIKLFGVALALTVLLSIYLAGTIARPVRRLAAAAERVRRGSGRQVVIPDFTQRGDEIGDLSGALREMTSALWLRMDAIEHFAADVAHEIKNPLTSLRSAVETAARVSDPEKQRRLLAVVLEDVHRLDRLITDISNASRLDAELSRDETALVPLDRLLNALIEIYADGPEPTPHFVLDLGKHKGAELTVYGTESQLVRVFRNLIDNAISFSPPSGTITVRARSLGDHVRVTVEDEGPGVPEGKLAEIFSRFYTERPAGEAFGRHSGLGLAISKQIVEAHHGSIRATNCCDITGAVVGACFTVELPRENFSD
ncbi:MAG TPA: stimulus-sensing domain-containing protein [Stellaceae bacterium]|nr:stimulus-sensing domain-containing protein [Stellaceae bacterium]